MDKNTKRNLIKFKKIQIWIKNRLHMALNHLEYFLKSILTMHRHISSI